MATIVTVLTEGFADAETALLNAAARSFFGLDTRFATPGGTAVTSAGGMRVTPDLALEDVDIDAVDAVAVCGGAIWQTPQAPDLGPLLHAAHDRGKVLGIICDATIAAARTGLLDDVDHTGNAAGDLEGTGYDGTTRYRDVPHAVSDQKVITAAGTAPVSFMAEMMRALGHGDEDLEYFVGLMGAEHAGAGQSG
jgi:transcriptional regulator GlxA family with amidase domain